MKKQISEYYWNEIEENVGGYKDVIVYKMIKDKFNLDIDSEELLEIIYNY